MKTSRVIAFATLSLLVLAVVKADGQLPRPKTNVQVVCEVTACESPSQPPPPPPPPPPSPPNITEAPREITPGAHVVIRGSGFGSSGVVYLKIGQRFFLLKVDPPQLWTDTEIAGDVPDVIGVPDQWGFITVVRERRDASNSRSVFFRAAQDTILLPTKAMTVVSCSSNAFGNVCNGVKAGWAGRGYGLGAPECQTDSSICAHHLNWIPVWGTDTYSVTFKNGWVFVGGPEGVQVGKTIVGIGGGVGDPTGIIRDTASAQMRVDWHVIHPLYPFYPAILQYEVWIWIKGPKGVPFQ